MRPWMRAGTRLPPELCDFLASAQTSALLVLRWRTTGEGEVALPAVPPPLLLADSEQASEGKVPSAHGGDHQIHYDKHRVVAPTIRP